MESNELLILPSSSYIMVSPREVVTENDPLGALKSLSLPHLSACSNRSLVRNGTTLGSPPPRATLSTSFKIGFSRYTPSRLSIRKADLKVPQQFIENALTNFSPSSLTSKKIQRTNTRWSQLDQIGRIFHGEENGRNKGGHIYILEFHTCKGSGCRSYGSRRCPGRVRF
ncbi:hypothetical protein NQ317_008268 [Molorchus minor]|uniref:Uncharacterized protein n=1 Tax=Molorchus minor TaxID=1323400 RepID=A0ABQ9J8G0_9CUCU|nr:hypothetical protein NQ317_008268 [Molorchus minor]